MNCNHVTQHPEGTQATSVLIQQFIAQTFLAYYGARISSFCTHLLGIRDSNGSLCAAAGYNLAEDGVLFLEQYLDTPIEMHVKQRLGFDIQRGDLVEVGNLATQHAGGARMLIRLMTEHLHHINRHWVVFTGTTQLINSFNRMGLPTLKLSPANPNKISNPDTWGSYYTNRPWVVLGNIALGYAHLARVKNTPAVAL